MNIFNEKLNKSKEGLKKFGRRAQEKVLQKLGTHTGTNDPAFEATVQRVERLDKNLHNMYDNMNTYLEAMETMQKATKNLAASFGDMLSEENEEFIKRRMAESYDEEDPENKSFSTPAKNELPVDLNLLKAVEEFVNETIYLEKWSSEVISSTCKETIIRPAGEKLKEIPALKHKIATRQQKLLDYDSYRAKLNAEQSKNPGGSEHSTKLEQKLEAARTRVDSVTTEESAKCTTIERNKTELIINGAASLVAVQTIINSRTAQKLEPLLTKVPQAAPALCMICSKTNEMEIDTAHAKRKK